MKTNKTPIQEALRICKDSVPLIQNDTSRQYINDIYRNISLLLEKEKQFAFDCFQAGNRFGMDVCGSFDWGQQPTKPDFDEFYSKYVSQHTK